MSMASMELLAQNFRKPSASFRQRSFSKAAVDGNPRLNGLPGAFLGATCGPSLKRELEYRISRKLPEVSGDLRICLQEQKKPPVGMSWKTAFSRSLP